MEHMQNILGVGGNQRKKHCFIFISKGVIDRIFFSVLTRSNNRSCFFFNYNVVNKNNDT